MEQADDVALFSTTSEGLQRKVNIFAEWCGANFMVISALKNKWMIFGELPRRIPELFVGAQLVDLVYQYKYVGVIFTSVTRNIFSQHYHTKVSKARNVANITFAAEPMHRTWPRQRILTPSLYQMLAHPRGSQIFSSFSLGCPNRFICQTLMFPKSQ